MGIALIRLRRYIVGGQNGVDTTIRTVVVFTLHKKLSDV